MLGAPSRGPAGARGQVIEVEADAASGLPAFTIAGCRMRPWARPGPGAGGDRQLRTAVHPARLTVNLAGRLPEGRLRVRPGRRGRGADGFGPVAARRVSDVVHLGELGLDGRLRAVRGVLPAVLAAARPV